jgi:hypothetical protein
VPRHSSGSARRELDVAASASASFDLDTIPSPAIPSPAIITSAIINTAALDKRVAKCKVEMDGPRP